MEDKYVQDVKDLTETYEAEKLNLMNEIEKLTELYQKVVYSNPNLNPNLTQINSDTQDQFVQTENNYYISKSSNSPTYSNYNIEHNFPPSPPLPPPSLPPSPLVNMNSNMNTNMNTVSYKEEYEESFYNKSQIPTPSSPPSTTTTTELSVIELRRLLDLEVARSQKAQEQIYELEEILEAQRSSFRMHLARERDIAISSTPVEVPTSDSEIEALKSTVSYSNNQFSTSINHLKEILQSINSTTSVEQIEIDIQQCLHILESNQLNQFNQLSNTRDDDTKNDSHEINDTNFVQDENNLIPNWYFQVLKKLRQRIFELESTLSSKILINNNTNNNNVTTHPLTSPPPVSAPITPLPANINSNINPNTTNTFMSDQLTEIKARYEDALMNSQIALEEQTKLAKSQIERLEDIIRNSKLEHQESDQQELTQMKILIDQYKEKLVHQEKAHADELQGVWNHFQRYREAQDLLTSSLETEIRTQGSIKTAAFRDNSEKSMELLELSSLCDIKRSSLRAVLNALAVLNANTITEQNGKQNQNQNQNLESKSLREELLEARLNSSEREVFFINLDILLFIYFIIFCFCRI